MIKSKKTLTGGQAAIQSLKKEKVEHVFGLIGSATMEMFDALYYEKKGFGYLLAEKDINEQLYDLIISLFKNKSLIKKILINQSQYSDKNIFKNMNTHIEKIINEKN